MSIIDSVRKSLVPIHPEGYVFIGIFGATSFFLNWLSPTLGWLGFIATGWCVYFFRDPPRVTPLREGAVVSPADGVISAIGFFATARTWSWRRPSAAHLRLYERI